MHSCWMYQTFVDLNFIWMNFCPLNVGKKQNKTPPNKIRLKPIFTKNQNVFKIFVQNEKNYRFAVTKLKKNLPFFW